MLLPSKYEMPPYDQLVEAGLAPPGLIPQTLAQKGIEIVGDATKNRDHQYAVTQLLKELSAE